VELDRVGGSVDLEASYSPVSVTGVGGRLGIDAQSCAISVRDVAGPARLRNSYDKIEVRGAGGTLNIDGQSCAILVDGVRGALDVTNSYDYVIVKRSEGPIAIKGDSSPVEISQVVRLPGAGGYTVETTYKRITVELPEDASATVHAETTYGEVRADFPMTYRKNGHREGEAVLGSGTCPVRLITSGDIVLRRGSAGR
jgi:hypothetical protein